MNRRTGVGLALAAMLVATAAVVANAPATLVLKSGARLTGELVDMGGSGFTMIVNGQQQQIATMDVAVIDFTGGSTMPSTETAQVPASGGLVVLRGGQSFQGSLADVSGTSPLKLTFDTSSGRREVSSDEVGRIYLSRPAGAVATNQGTSSSVTGTSGSTGAVGQTTGTASSGGNVTVPANQTWTRTGIVVNRGDHLVFTVSGQVQLSTSASDVATPDGSTQNRYARSAPLPNTLAGALIGRVGTGRAFGIGAQDRPIPMPESGELYLGINDDQVADNVGSFSVTINRASAAAPR